MAQRGFNIGVFRSEVSRKGILKTNQFLVQFNIPQGLVNTTNYQTHFDTVQHLEYWCEEIQLPTQGFRSWDAKRYGYGATEKRVTGPINPDVNCMFIEHSDGAIQKFFHRWLGIVYNRDMKGDPNEKSGEVNTAGLGSSGGVLRYEPYELSFKDEYVTNVTIMVYESTGGQPIRTIVLRDAFPIAIGSVNLGWHERNTYFKLPVSFTYTDLYEEVSI